MNMHPLENTKFDIGDHVPKLSTRLKKFLLGPFRGLSERAKTLLQLRISCMLVHVIVISIVLNSNAENMPTMNLNCSHVSMARGLFDALKNTFNDENSFLTTSEINILADYIENQIESTPEMIQTGLYNWCSVTFAHPALTFSNGDNGGFLEGDDSEHDGIHENGLPDNMQNVTFHCSPKTKGYFFDYRSELSDIGLNVILAYAYDANFKSDLSTIQYSPDTSYVDSLTYRKESLKRFLALAVISILLSSIMIISTFFYYAARPRTTPNIMQQKTTISVNTGSKGNIPVIFRSYLNFGLELKDSDKNTSIWFKNYFAFASLLNLIISFAGFISIILNILQYQKRIHTELSNFGIAIYFGKTFVSLIIVWFIFSFIIFLLWAGPIWFNRTLSNETTEDQGKLLDSFENTINHIGLEQYPTAEDQTQSVIRNHYDDQNDCEYHFDHDRDVYFPQENDLEASLDPFSHAGTVNPFRESTPSQDYKLETHQQALSDFESYVAMSPFPLSAFQADTVTEEKSQNANSKGDKS